MMCVPGCAKIQTGIVVVGVFMLANHDVGSVVDSLFNVALCISS